MEFGGQDENLNTVFPKNPNLALKKRRVIKESRSLISRQMERFFVIDNEIVTYFKKEADVQFKKHLQLVNVTASLDAYSNATNDNDTNWHERK